MCIDKRLTHHVVRKTFASTVLLYHNVPMEVVSVLLGHESIKVTEASYAKLHQKKIASEMKLLVKRLEAGRGEN